MTLIMLLTAIFNVSVLVLLAGIAWYASKTAAYMKDVWIYFNLAAKEQGDANKRLDEIAAFLRLLFKKGHAEEIKDILRAKENAPRTVKVLCDDGEERELPMDEGF